MKNYFSRFEIPIVIVGVILFTVLIFRQYVFGHKILFPSNLLVSTYAPWKYEPDPEYPSGPPNKPMGFDDIRQFYPNRQLLAESLHAGVLPLWNPYIYSGTPFMAAFDTAVWYPLSWLAALIPAPGGWNVLVIIQPILSVLFMYLFLRSLKFSASVSAYGSFVYAFSGWMVVYWQEILVLEHSFLWLPLALYASNRIWKNSDDWPGFFLLIIALACSIFAGFLQMSIYVYATAAIWNIYCFLSHDRIARAAAGKRIVYAVSISLLIASVQIIPSLEAYRISPRGGAEGGFIFRDFLLPVQYLITMVAPDFWGSPATYNYFGGEGFYFEKMIYIGIVPLLLALYGIVSSKKKSVAFWSVAALVTFSMGFALPTSWWPNILRIPVLSNSYPTRIFAVAVFAFSVLCCYGVAGYTGRANRKLLAGILVGLTLLLASGWVVAAGSWCIYHNYPQSAVWCSERTSFVWDMVRKNHGIMDQLSDYATVSLRNLLIPTLFMVGAWTVLIFAGSAKKYGVALIWVLTIASAFYFAQKYVYVAEPRFVYPARAVTNTLSAIAGYDRVWGYGNAYIEKNTPEYFRWYSTDGYGNLSSDRYAELLSTIVNEGKLGGAIRRSDTDLYAMSERDPMDANPYRLRMMSLLGVKYIVESKIGDLKDTRTTGERFPASLFRLVWQDNVWRVWQYTEVLPRVMFPTKAIVERDGQKIVDMLYEKSFDPSETVILENEPKEKLNEKEGTGSAQIISYTLNTVSVAATSSSGGYVFLTDNYYPGWTAVVDGNPAPVLRADYSFRAVPVPAGNHTVVFSYRPVTVIAGTVIAVLGVLLGIVFFAYDKVRRKKQK